MPKTRRKILIAILLLLLVSPTLPAADWEDTWPQWRGPHRDGRAGGPAWPDGLGGLRAEWRVELGKGYPGPIVAADRVFVAETLGENEIVRALDRTTGRELWQASWPGTWKVPFFAAANGSWIRSTPAFDGETLYVGGIREVLVALDAADGSERWRVDFPARYGTKPPDFGFASSPMVVGEHLYIQAANSLVKVNKSDGATVWRSLAGSGDIMESGAFSSPVLASLAGREQLVVQSRTTLYGVDPETGEELWSQQVPHFRGMNILTPTVFGDSVFTSSYRNGSFRFAVQAGDESFQVSELWKHKVQAYMSSPIVIDGHAYMHLQNQRFACLNLESGEGCWTSKPFGKYWSMATQGDKILALDEEGELLLIRADPTALQILDQKEIASAETWGHLAVSGDQIFIRELEAIAAYRWSEAAAPSATVTSAP
ncbi:MAG: PQQ-binding-like beta-propeller repeat protein [Acidobacteriota bacterium]